MEHSLRWLIRLIGLAAALVILLALSPGAARAMPNPDVVHAATCGPAAAPADGAPVCSTVGDTVLAQDAVGPSWIPWDSPCLPNADLVYVDNRTWNVWVMDQWGGNQRCLTCWAGNALQVRFPLDLDGVSPAIHWKGAPTVHPSQPIFFISAENEYSAHNPLLNTPSIGWDNDIWALNVCTKRYTRLTQLAAGLGTQHSAISNDGKWYVYPLRYDYGNPPLDFGLAKMVFNEVAVDSKGDAVLQPRFESDPNGPMYYEPSDVFKLNSTTYVLTYAAGAGNLLDAYRYEWSCSRTGCSGRNSRLSNTPNLHEEFMMFAPSGKRLTWMAGPIVNLMYNADLYLSAVDFSNVQRLTWYNDCLAWPDGCKPFGAQLSPIAWKQDDGMALFYSLWLHNGTMPFASSELHRLDLTAGCSR